MTDAEKVMAAIMAAIDELEEEEARASLRARVRGGWKRCGRREAMARRDLLRARAQSVSPRPL